MKTSLLKTTGGRLSGAVIMLLIWQFFSIGVADAFILPPPSEVFHILGQLIVSGSAFNEFIMTLTRSMAGLAIALIVGIITGILLGINKTIFDFFHTPIILVQSSPAIAWILLAIIWFSVKMVPIYVIAITVTPVITLNCAEGILRTDRKILEMARIYHVGRFKILRHIYFPSIAGYLMSALKIAVGLTFRVAVMAEVLVHPGNGVGEKMNWARINIETGEVMAWMIIIVAATVIFDGLVSMLFNVFFRRYND